MKLLSIAYLVLGASALPRGRQTRAAPTIYTAGDSTMAAKGANNGLTDGENSSNYLRLRY